VPGHAAAAPGSTTPELDSTHMNGLTDDKKRSIVPAAQSKILFDACHEVPHSRMMAVEQRLQPIMPSLNAVGCSCYAIEFSCVSIPQFNGNDASR